MWGNLKLARVWFSGGWRWLNIVDCCFSFGIMNLHEVSGHRVRKRNTVTLVHIDTLIYVLTGVHQLMSLSSQVISLPDLVAWSCLQPKTAENWYKRTQNTKQKTWMIALFHIHSMKVESLAKSTSTVSTLFMKNNQSICFRSPTLQLFLCSCSRKIPT